MATEFIDYNDKGFLTSDRFMQLALYYINEEFKENQYVFTNKDTLLKYHEEVINGYMAGWFAFLWDEYISSTTEEQTMVQVLQNVKITLLNIGTFVSISELQAIPTVDEDFKLLYSRKPFPISELIKIIDALIQMLQGTWTSDNYDMDINYRY
jgi:S-methylmethionine-dependent homocysteine/selenocysteine methylase